MSQPIDLSRNGKGATEGPPPMTPELVARLKEALSSIGAFGEVRLVILKGRVRFIETVRSESVGQRPEERSLIE